MTWKKLACYALPTLWLTTLWSCGPLEDTALTLRQGLTKGQPGAVRGDKDYCYDPNTKCDIGEGACGNHNHCLTGLKCAPFGDLYGLPGVQVCHPAHCVNGRLDAASGELGVDCGGPCGPCAGPDTCYNGALDGDEQGVDCGGSCQACEQLALTVNSPLSEASYLEALPPRATGRVSALDPNQRAHRTIQLLIDGTPVGTTQSASNGAWDFRLPARPPGLYTFTARVDNGGLISQLERLYRVVHTSGGHALSQLITGSKSSSVSLRAVTADADLHLIVAGVFSGDLNVGVTTLQRQPATTLAAFVAKYDPQGVPQWATRLGSDRSTTIQAIQANAAGELYLLGDFEGAIDLGAGVVSAQGKRDAFLAKLSAQGQLLWGRVLPATVDTSIRQLALTPQDEVVVAANFLGDADLGGATLTSAGGLDLYVAKYDSSGSPLWSFSFGSTDLDTVNDLGVDAQGNLYLTGLYSTSIQFDTETLVGQGSGSAYLTKLNPQGKTLWAKDIGADVYDVGVRLAVSPAGEVVVGGIFFGDVDLGSGVFTTSTTDNQDLFLARYNAQGQHMWSRQLQAGLNDNFTDIALTSLGQVVVSGVHFGALNLGLGARSVQGHQDGFLAVYSAQGAPLRQRFFSTGRTTTPRGLAVDRLDAAHLVGDLVGAQLDLGGGPIAHEARRAGFLATYR